MLIQSGDSDAGREFGARTADAIFTRHGAVTAAQAFYRDLKDRLPRYGRVDADVTILPATTFALGDTAEEAPRSGRTPPRPGRPADRDRVPGAGVGPRPVGLRPGRPAARRRPGSGRRRRSPGAGCGTRRTRMAVAAAVARAGRGQGWAVHPRADHRDDRAAVVRRHPDAGGRQMDDYVQADASRRLHPGPHLRPGGLDEFVAGGARSCRTWAATAPTTPARPCATTSACPSRRSGAEGCISGERGAACHVGRSGGLSRRSADGGPRTGSGRRGTPSG